MARGFARNFLGVHLADAVGILPINAAKLVVEFLDDMKTSSCALSTPSTFYLNS